MHGGILYSDWRGDDFPWASYVHPDTRVTSNAASRIVPKSKRSPCRAVGGRPVSSLLAHPSHRRYCMKSLTLCALSVSLLLTCGSRRFDVRVTNSILYRRRNDNSWSDRQRGLHNFRSSVLPAAGSW